ncbi:hypothetical protein HID58_042004, partial [Brassica napus]
MLYSMELSLINLEYIHIKCVAHGSIARKLNEYLRSTTANVVLVCSNGFNYVTNLEGGTQILFDTDIPKFSTSTQ